MTGAYLSGLALAIAYISLMDHPGFLLVPDLSISLAMIGLVAGMAFAVAARLERSWIPFVLVPVGIMATIASVFYRVAYYPGLNPSGCSVSSVHRGFPMPWDSSYNFVGNRCLLLQVLNSDPVIDMVFFSLDVVFYVAIGVAIIQLCRGIRGTTIIGRSSRANNMI